MKAGSPAVTQSVVVPLKMRESARNFEADRKERSSRASSSKTTTWGVHLQVVCGEQSGVTVTVPHHVKRRSRQGASNDDRPGPWHSPGSGQLRLNGLGFRV